MVDFIGDTPDALAWVEQETSARSHSQSPFGRLVSGVIWTDHVGPDGTVIGGDDPDVIAAAVVGDEILHNHDPGLPLGQVLAAKTFETSSGRQFVAAIFGLYTKDKIVRFATLGVDPDPVVASPGTLGDPLSDWYLEVACDPREVDEDWLQEVLHDSPLPVQRETLSHNSQEALTELVCIGLPFVILAWNPLITRVASRAGNALYAGVYAWLQRLWTKLQERRKSVVCISSYQNQCKVSFILRGNESGKLADAHQRIAVVAAQAARLIDDLRAKGFLPSSLIYECEEVGDEWYLSNLLLGDGRLVSDRRQLTPVEQLPSGLSLGLELTELDATVSEPPSLVQRLTNGESPVIVPRAPFVLPPFEAGDPAILKRGTQVLLLTATQTERDAVLERLRPAADQQCILRVFSGAQTYYVGRLGSVDIVLTTCRAGSQLRDGSTLVTHEAIGRVRPRSVVAVGMAFGGYTDKLKIGDVLVSTHLIPYEPSRKQASGDIHRGGEYVAGALLLNRFLEARGWTFPRSDGSACCVRDGRLLSGEKLVDSLEFKAELFATHPEALGGEMEGSGVYAAAERCGISEWIIVKAVCDWADGTKHKEHQPLAATAAVAFLEHVFTPNGVLDDLPPFRGGEEDRRTSGPPRDGSGPPSGSGARVASVAPISFIPVRKGVAFVRTDVPGPMHEVALNLFASDGNEYVDVHGSAFLIGPGIALTARHNVEIFLEHYDAARQRGEARGPMDLIAVQTWLDPKATVVHRVSKWFAAPWTDLAVLRLQPAADQVEPLPENYRWRALRLDLTIPPVGAEIAAFGFDDVQVTHGEREMTIRARGATTTGVVVEVLDPFYKNAHHGWPRFQTNARFDGGMSGGPVIHSGRACGVISSSLPAQTEDEDHASFVPLLWPAMAIEVDDPRPAVPESSTVTLLQLAREGIISARGNELVELTRDQHGAIIGVGLRDQVVGRAAAADRAGANSGAVIADASSQMAARPWPVDALDEPSVALPGPSHESGKGTDDDYLRLHEGLAKLNDPQFERLVLQSGLDRSVISPSTAPLAMRAVDVARLAKNDPALCRKLEQLLGAPPPPPAGFGSDPDRATSELEERLERMKRDLIATLKSASRVCRQLAERVACEPVAGDVAERLVHLPAGEVVTRILAVLGALPASAEGDADHSALRAVLFIVLPYVSDWRAELAACCARGQGERDSVELRYRSDSIAEAVMAGWVGRRCQFEYRAGTEPYGFGAVQIPAAAQTALFASEDHLLDQVVDQLARQLDVGGLNAHERTTRVRSEMRRRGDPGPERMRYYFVFRDAASPEPPDALWSLACTKLHGSVPELVLVRMKGQLSDTEADLESGLAKILRARTPRP